MTGVQRPPPLPPAPSGFTSLPPGPSGSGKSTLLHLAGGLDTPTTGDVLIDGRSVVSLTAAARAAARRQHVGYVFQELNLMPSLTAVENVMLPRELDGVSRRTARTEALTVLAELGLADAADRFPDQLSGGEQQRVAIARSLGASAAVALAAAEGRDDAATLAAVGAAPRTRRRLAAAQALVIAGLGGAGGVASGLLAGWALVQVRVTSPVERPASGHAAGGPEATFAGLWSSWDVIVPWPDVIALGVVLPLVLAAAAYLLTRSQLPLVRRRT